MRAGQPYHFGNGIDLRPCRPPGGNDDGGIGRPRPKVLAADGGVKDSQGKQKVRRSARRSYFLAELRVLIEGVRAAKRSDRCDIITFRDCDNQPASVLRVD